MYFLAFELEWEEWVVFAESALPIAQAGLQVAMWVRITSASDPLAILPSDGITGMNLQTQIGLCILMSVISTLCKL